MLSRLTVFSGFCRLPDLGRQEMAEQQMDVLHGTVLVARDVDSEVGDLCELASAEPD